MKMRPETTRGRRWEGNVDKDGRNNQYRTVSQLDGGKTRGSEEELSLHRTLQCAECYPTPALLNSGGARGNDVVVGGADLLRYPSGFFA